MSDKSYVLLGIFTLAGTGLTAIMGFLIAWMQIGARRNLDQINDAVNNRHPRKSKLYDLVLESHAKNHELSESIGELIIWKRGFKDGVFENGDRVAEFARDVTSRLERLESKQ